MCQDQFARMVIKRGTGVPTIPVSADHRNGDWIATDIYEGEQYMDTDTGIIYSRNSSDIFVVGQTGTFVSYIANISQTGTNAPTADVFENSLGGTVTFSYVGVGQYELTLTGAFTADKTVIEVNNFVSGGLIQAFRKDADDIVINTFNTSLAATNGVLSDSSIIVKVYA
jgi:hypothetical protein